MCRSHATVRELLGAVVAEAQELTVVDLEAGLENFSRGTPRHAHTLLIVLEPYYKALETGRRVAELAREFGTERILGVANKVRSQADADAIQEFAATHGIGIVGFIPHDDAILDADRAGASPMDVNPPSLAVRAIQQIAEAIA